MTLIEIKKAIEENKIVYWKQENYIVHKVKNDYFITCTNNNHSIGLVWQDNVTLNGKEIEFFTKDKTK